jgi:nucleoside-diphosphate-sugar epimerase
MTRRKRLTILDKVENCATAIAKGNKPADITLQGDTILILVTGSAGLIGSAIVARLRGLGIAVREFDKAKHAAEDVRDVAAPRTFDVARFYGDPSRAGELLGWRTTINIEQGMQRLIAEFAEAECQAHDQARLA